MSEMCKPLTTKTATSLFAQVRLVKETQAAAKPSSLIHIANNVYGWSGKSNGKKASANKAFALGGSVLPLSLTKRSPIRPSQSPGRQIPHMCVCLWLLIANTHTYPHLYTQIIVQPMHTLTRKSVGSIINRHSNAEIWNWLINYPYVRLVEGIPYSLR